MRSIFDVLIYTYFSVAFSLVYAAMSWEYIKIRRSTFCIVVFFTCYLNGAIFILAERYISVLQNSRTWNSNIFFILTLIVMGVAYWLCTDIKNSLFLYIYTQCTKFCVFIYTVSKHLIICINRSQPVFNNAEKIVAQGTIVMISAVLFVFFERRIIAGVIYEYRNAKIWLGLSVSPIICTVSIYLIYLISSQYSYALLFSLIGFYITSMFGDIMGIFMLRYSVEKERYKTKMESTDVLISYQREQYSRMAGLVDETRKLRHDMKHRINEIAALVEMGEYDELKEVIAHSATENPFTIVRTGNAVADAMIGHYINVAKTQRINVIKNIVIPKESKIEDADLSILFSSCLENAIELCKLIEDGERWIKIYSSVKGNYLLIFIENGIDENILTNIIQSEAAYNDVRKDSLIRVCEQYGGELQEERTEELFRVKMMLKYV